MQPNTKARIAGLGYAVSIVGGAFNEIFVRGRLIVASDPTATASNILAHEQLFRLGLASAIVTLLGDTVVAVMFYDLLRPVSRTLSLLAAAARFIFVAIMAVNAINYYAPLVLLKFDGEQFRQLTVASQRLYNGGFHIANVFFGLHCAVVGWLIWKSNFLPKFLAAFGICGLGYIAHSFLRFVAPATAPLFAPYFLWTGFVLELMLTVWLLVAGIDGERWNRQALAVASPQPA